MQRKPQTYGNLALDHASGSLAEVLAQLSTAEPWAESKELKREKEEAQLQLARQKERLHMQRIRKASGLARAKAIVRNLAVLAVISFVFGGLMFRQAGIFEMNFHNTRMRNQIAEELKKNSESREALLRQTDMKHIAGEALRLFGLRKPSQLQRVAMQIPETDKTIFYNHGMYEVKDAESSGSNYYVLEAYMKAAQRGRNQQK